MLGRSETSTGRSAAAPAAELPGTDLPAQSKADLERFVADMRDKLHQMRRTIECHRRPAATATGVLPPPAAATTAAEPPSPEAAGSFAPQRDWEITAERSMEAVTAQPIAVCESDSLQAAGPAVLPVDPQDQLQSLKARLARQLQGTGT